MRPIGSCIIQAAYEVGSSPLMKEELLFTSFGSVGPWEHVTFNGTVAMYANRFVRQIIRVFPYRQFPPMSVPPRHLDMSEFHP